MCGRDARRGISSNYCPSLLSTLLYMLSVAMTWNTRLAEAAGQGDRARLHKALVASSLFPDESLARLVSRRLPEALSAQILSLDSAGVGIQDMLFCAHVAPDSMAGSATGHVFEFCVCSQFLADTTYLILARKTDNTWIAQWDTSLATWLSRPSARPVWLGIESVGLPTIVAAGLQGMRGSVLYYLVSFEQSGGIIVGEMSGNRLHIGEALDPGGMRELTVTDTRDSAGVTYEIQSTYRYDKGSRRFGLAPSIIIGGK